MESRMQLYGLAVECPQDDDCKDCYAKQQKLQNNKKIRFFINLFKNNYYE